MASVLVLQDSPVSVLDAVISQGHSASPEVPTAAWAQPLTIDPSITWGALSGSACRPCSEVVSVSSPEHVHPSVPLFPESEVTQESDSRRKVEGQTLSQRGASWSSPGQGLELSFSFSQTCSTRSLHRENIFHRYPCQWSCEHRPFIMYVPDYTYVNPESTEMEPYIA